MIQSQLRRMNGPRIPQNELACVRVLLIFKLLHSKSLQVRLYTTIQPSTLVLRPNATGQASYRRE